MTSRGPGKDSALFVVRKQQYSLPPPQDSKDTKKGNIPDRASAGGRTAPRDTPGIPGATASVWEFSEIGLHPYRFQWQWSSLRGTHSAIPFHNPFSLFFKIFVRVQLIHNVLVSDVQQSESDIHIHISTLFQILFPYRPLQSIEKSSLHYTVGPY